MTIAAECQCGQRFTVKDELAGKKAKCPKCGSIFRIPTASSPPPPAPPSAQNNPVPPPPPARPAGLENLGSLFDEEEIGVAGKKPVPAGQGKVCPGCRKVVPAEALLCVECGWNFELGKQLETKRGPAKRRSDNPYAVSAPYFDEDGNQVSSGGRGSRHVESKNRKGPVWETDDALVGKYFQTVLDILISPAFAFGTMRIHGGLGAPIAFTLVGYIFAAIFAVVLILASATIFGKVPGTSQEIPVEALPAFGLAMVCGMVIGMSCAMVFLSLLVPVAMILSSAILHACLMIVGGAKHGFEGTFRASGYAFGALILPETVLGLIPVVGVFLSYALQWGYTLVAIKYTHETQWWQAFVAAILWAIVIVGILLAIVIFFTAMVVAQMGLENGMPPQGP